MTKDPIDLPDHDVVDALPEACCDPSSPRGQRLLPWLMSTLRWLNVSSVVINVRSRCWW